MFQHERWELAVLNFGSNQRPLDWQSICSTNCTPCLYGQLTSLKSFNFIHVWIICDSMFTKLILVKRIKTNFFTNLTVVYVSVPLFTYYFCKWVNRWKKHGRSVTDYVCVWKHTLLCEQMCINKIKMFLFHDQKYMPFVRTKYTITVFSCYLLLLVCSKETSWWNIRRCCFRVHFRPLGAEDTLGWGRSGFVGGGLQVPLQVLLVHKRAPG